MSAKKTNPNPEPDDQPEQAPPPNPIQDASVREQLEAAMAERDELRNKWLKAEAELDNYRKRVQREAEELRRYQAMPLARELLPGLDNLQRAIRAAETSKNIDDLVQGLSMVEKQLEDILRRHSIEPIEAVGQPFDPNLHEALQQTPSAEHPPMTVLQELERGYTLHDRVVRPTKVIVSSGPPPDDEETPSE